MTQSKITTEANCCNKFNKKMTILDCINGPYDGKRQTINPLFPHKLLPNDAVSIDAASERTSLSSEDVERITNSPEYNNRKLCLYVRKVVNGKDGLHYVTDLTQAQAIDANKIDITLSLEEIRDSFVS